jgi:hypothetical protein
MLPWVGPIQKPFSYLSIYDINSLLWEQPTLPVFRVNACGLIVRSAILIIELISTLCDRRPPPSSFLCRRADCGESESSAVTGTFASTFAPAMALVLAVHPRLSRSENVRLSVAKR